MVEKKMSAKAWQCKECGWVLGFVRRQPKKVHRLFAFNQAQEPDKAKFPTDTGLFAQIDGRADIRCSHCGVTRNWHPTEGVLTELIERRLARHGGGGEWSGR